jgi:CheY-like chemotaxis protein
MSSMYILYADDDHDDQEMLKEIFRSIESDIELINVDSGWHLINYLEALTPGSNYPCLILLDLNMPILDGIETLKRLKAHHIYKKIPVILFSTTDAAEGIQESKELGAEDFVTKPVKVEEFKQVALQFLQRCEAVPNGSERVV